MKIISIFDEKLYSFKYDEIFETEYDKKLHEWENFEYIHDKAVKNNIGINDIDQFFDEIYYDREFIIESIDECIHSNELFNLFSSLYNNSIQLKKFEESKCKVYIDNRLSRLRLYALRINNKCFIITGGAIKFTQRMEDHEDTFRELQRIRECRNFLLEKDYTEDEIIDNHFD